MTRKTTAQPKADEPAARLDPSNGRAPKPSKLDQLEAMLRRPGGATLAQMQATTSWQKHSVRGAIAGALKKRGLAITSEKVGEERRYCAAAG